MMVAKATAATPILPTTTLKNRMIIFATSTSTIPLWIVLGYLVLLLGLGIFSSKFFRGTSKDYFVASRSIGSFMLLMSVFGTTMTGFALVGSSGKAFTTGVATYGAVAAWSGIIHSAIFFIIGLRLWAFGKRHGSRDTSRQIGL